VEEKMSDIEIINLTPDSISEYGVCGYKDIKKHLELRKKIDWFNEYYPRGLRIKALISKVMMLYRILPVLSVPFVSFMMEK
jgi:hypothetical protein